MVSKVMAGCVALAAFAIAIFAGLAAGNAAGLVLLRALMAMILCYPVGLIAGLICEHVVAMHKQSQDAQADRSETDASSVSDGTRTSKEEVTTV